MLCYFCHFLILCIPHFLGRSKLSFFPFEYEVKFWSLRKVWKANFIARISRLLIRHILSSYVRVSRIHVVPPLTWRLSEVLVCSRDLGGWLERGIPLQISRFWINPKSSCFKSLLRTMLPLCDPFFFRA